MSLIASGSLSKSISKQAPEVLPRASRARRFGIDCESELRWHAKEPGGDYKQKLLIKNVSNQVLPCNRVSFPAEGCEGVITILQTLHRFRSWRVCGRYCSNADTGDWDSWIESNIARVVPVAWLIKPVLELLTPRVSSKHAHWELRGPAAELRK